MPRYVYECDSCNEVFQVSHSIKEKLEECECSGSLRRIPSMPSIIKVKTDGSAARKVHKHIQEAKQELALDREKRRKEKQ